MVKGIIQAQKLGRQKIQQPVVMNGPLNITLTTPNCHYKSNQIIDVTSNELATTETYSTPINDLIYITDDQIQNKTLS